MVEIEKKMSFSEIRYSQVWEDFQLLDAGLAFAEGESVLAIASAGCNVLNIALRPVAKIDAIDLSAPQLALLELKIAAIKHLSYEEFIGLLGLVEGFAASRTYKKLRPFLQPVTREFFDAKPELWARGLWHCGRLEAYFTEFRENHLRPLCPQLCDPHWLFSTSLEEQRQKLTDVPRDQLRQIIVSYFNFAGLTRGRSRAQMSYVLDDNIGEGFFKKFWHILETSLISNNSYLYYFLTGNFLPEDFGPDYLRAENYQRLKSAVSKIHLHCSSIESWLEASETVYDKMNLSDIFEYMSPVAAENSFQMIHSRLATGGRIAFWNLLVPRRPQNGYLLYETTRPDRLWFYDHFYVYGK